MSVRSCRKLLLAVSLIVAGASAFSAEPPAKTKPRVLVTISKETTHITEPLRNDGYPDYIAALNQRMSKGVTPENNAAVPFWKAMGPSEIKPSQRERYFQMLGIPPLPEKGDYFVTTHVWIERQEAKHDSQSAAPALDQEDALIEQTGSAMKRPWSKTEFPVWAEWLGANEKATALLVEACRRARRYEPLISGADNRGMLIAVTLPGAQASRECARLLTMRAMLRLGEGKVDDASDDLLNCHRLERLTGQGPTLIDALVAITIEGSADAGDRALLQHAKLTAPQIAKMRADLDKLPSMPTIAERLDVAERFMFLDCASTMAREGPSGIGRLDGGGTSKGVMQSLMDSLAGSAIDYDLILRMGNSWYDRMLAGCRKPTRAERRRAGEKLDADLNAMAKSAKDPKFYGLSLLGNPRKAISERIGQVLVSLLLPASGAAKEAEDRATMQWNLTQLAFALAACRADRGSYPEKLADLAPKYVKEVPKDIFNNDADLRYTREGDGYLLYSFGSNGKDDGGKGYDDRKNGEDWDDLAVRMSPARP